MKKISAAVLILSALLLTACVKPPAETEPQVSQTIDRSALDLAYYSKYKGQGKTISVYNWGEYISDGADGSLDVNAAFEEVTGVRVIYSNYDTNESLYAKLKTGGTSYDVIIPSDYMISRLIAEGLLQPIDFRRIPNIGNIDETYLHPPYDPTDSYSVPYTWGVLGIIYNTEMVDDPEKMNSWEVLWDEEFRNSILMIGNSKDAFGIAFKLLGCPINAESADAVDRAADLLKKQKKIIQAYVADEIFDKMIGCEAAMAPYFNGDAVTMNEDNPDLSFSIPKEGSNIFADAMCIPASSRNQELAEMYINFMLEPQVGLANTEAIGYSTPNVKVYELLDDDVKNNPVAYPSGEDLARCEHYVYVGPELSSYIDEKWPEILASDERYSAMLMPMFLLACLVGIVALNLKRIVRKNREK